MPTFDDIRISLFPALYGVNLIGEFSTFFVPETE